MENKFNKKKNMSSVFNYQITKEMEVPYKKLKDLKAEGITSFKVLGFYISAGKFGEAPVAYNDEYQVNLPKSWTEQIRENVTDDEFITWVNDGKCTMNIIEVTSSKYGKYLDVEFADE